MKGYVSLNIRKLLGNGGNMFGGVYISMKEVECAIKDIKEKKVTDKSGPIAGYLNGTEGY